METSLWKLSPIFLPSFLVDIGNWLARLRGAVSKAFDLKFKNFLKAHSKNGGPIKYFDDKVQIARLIVEAEVGVKYYHFDPLCEMNFCFPAGR